MANIEESKPENQDKIILYHGQSYGVWLFQLILKAFMFPDAAEDWLPLRFKPLEKDIDRTDLMKMINHNKLDNDPEYMELGLSVNANLVSKYHTMSAWYFICVNGWDKWQKIAGISFNGDYSFHSKMYDMIKKEFIPEKYWERFKKQKKVLYKFIQTKRNLKRNHNAVALYKEIQTLFPKTFNQFESQLKTLPSFWKYYFNWKRRNIEGVLLQIILDKEMADKLTYSSQMYGWVESTKHEKFKESLPWEVKQNAPWEGEDIEPYSEVYEQIKNRRDFNQARLALNKEFRSYPSRVRIKSIAGIMENPVDYEILKSMIKEMVEVNKKKKE